MAKARDLVSPKCPKPYRVRVLKRNKCHNQGQPASPAQHHSRIPPRATGLSQRCCTAGTSPPPDRRGRLKPVANPTPGAVVHSRLADVSVLRLHVAPDVGAQKRPAEGRDTCLFCCSAWHMAGVQEAFTESMNSCFSPFYR